MRIAIGGIMHESNTFAPQPTDRRLFKAGSLTSGDAMLPVWRDAHHEMGGFIEGAGKFGFDLLPTVMAWATPAGPVDDAVVDEVVAGIIDSARAGKADGVLLALHGAMVTPSRPGADGEVLRMVRAALPGVPVAASLDYHGNCSGVMADNADALVGYQTYPHVDQRQRGLLAAELLARAVRGEIKPVTAIAKPPMILNLLGQDTAREPMRSLMAAAREAERRPGMLSVSVMAGFPYADVPDMGPAVIAVADRDRVLAQAVADELSAKMWAVRHELYVPCPTPEEAVRRAMAASSPSPLAGEGRGGGTRKGPIVLVDLGDNIGGGSAGDGTVLLAELLRQKATGAVVALYAPEAVRIATKIGCGRPFEREVGGVVDKLHGDPVRVRGTVRSLHGGKWVEPEARHGGRRHNDQGPVAVITLEGGNLLLLNSLRTPPFSLGQLTSAGIDPRAASIIVVKAAVAHKAAYAPVAAEMIEVDTPGITAINPARFTYRRIRRPMFPLDNA